MKNTPVRGVLPNVATEPVRAATYREVFAVGEFRALFAAHLLSVLGDQMARVALAVLVFDRTRSAGLTALAYALTFLPSLVAGPLLSGLADRYSRRTLMIITDIGRAVLVAGMTVPGLPLFWVCALLVAVQMLAAPFNAARAATVALVLTGDRYVVGSAVSNLSFQLAQLLGFAAGGLVVAGLGTSGALLADSATFVLSGLLIVFGVRARPVPNAETASSSWLADLGAGVRLVAGHPRLRSLVLLGCVSGCYIAAEGLAVPYTTAHQAGSVAAGLMLAANPAGDVVGIVLIRRLRPDLRLRLMGPLAVASCVPLLGFVFDPPVVVAVAVLALSGLASAYQVAANAAFVQAVPDGRRGQAFGLASTAMLVAQGLGILLAGAMAEVITPGMAIAALGLIGVAGAVLASAAWGRASGSTGEGVATH